MQYRQLGRSDLKVSTIGMGCWAIVGDKLWGKQDEADAIAALRTCLDVGVNLFDTAEAYGDGYSEELLAKALKGVRDEVVIATKVSPNHFAANDVIAACEASLRRLKTDYIDLYQLHWPSREIGAAETMGAMRKLQQQGKIRYIGVSNCGPNDLRDYLAHGRAESNQMAYNLLFRAVEFETQPVCVEEELGILCYSPLMQALLTGKFATVEDVPEGRARSRHFRGDRPLARHGEEGCEAETFAAIDAVRAIAAEQKEPMANVSMAWLLEQPAVTTVLAGARNPDQVRRNATAAALALAPETVAALSDATAELKERLGANADMWQGESRIR